MVEERVYFYTDSNIYEVTQTREFEKKLWVTSKRTDFEVQLVDILGKGVVEDITAKKVGIGGLGGSFTDFYDAFRSARESWEGVQFNPATGRLEEQNAGA